MHEASLAGGVLQLVEETARREGFARLLVLRLEAGQLAGVDGRALRFALESLAPGPLLDGARIDLDEHGLRTDGGDIAAGGRLPSLRRISTATHGRFGAAGGGHGGGVGMTITPCAALLALQAATSPEAMPLRPVQACAGRLGAAVLSPLSHLRREGDAPCGLAEPVPREHLVGTWCSG